MLNSGQEYYTRISPAEITQISFGFASNQILNKDIKIIPIDEKLHKKYRKKWKFFSRILLRKFTIRFSKELYRVSLTVIQLRKYYMYRKLQRWYLRFKWSRMTHKIHRIYYLQQIKTRALSLKEKEKKKSPNLLKWKTMSRLLITSEIRSKLYAELNLLIQKRRIKKIAKWNEMSAKLRPKNLQIVQKSFEEKRHAKYVYRKFFLRWLLKYRNQEDSIKYIFKVEYPEMMLQVHMNLPFELGSYSRPFDQSSILSELSLLKDIYDFNELLYANELENIPDLFIPELNDNSSLVKNAFIQSYSPVRPYKQITIPKMVVNYIYDNFNDMQSHLFSKDDHLNLSFSSSLSYFQSCPQFQLQDDLEIDVSISMSDLSKDSLSLLDNYEGKHPPVTEFTNTGVDIPLQLGNISDNCTRSLAQFQIKPSAKEQKADVNVDIDLSGIKQQIYPSSLTNYKHFIKKSPNFQIEPEVPLSFQNISGQDSSKKTINNFQAKDLKGRGIHVGKIYHNFKDFERSVSSTKEDYLDRCFIESVDCESNLFNNLQEFKNVATPKTNGADNIKIDVVFLDEVLPLQKSLSPISSTEFFKLQQSKNKEANKTDKVSKSKSNANSEDEYSIDIEFELSEEIPSHRSNLEKVQTSNSLERKNKDSKKTDQTTESKDTNKVTTSFPIHQYNPNLSSYSRYLKYYKTEEKGKENEFLFDVGENDLSFTPDYSLILKQPNQTLQQINNAGPTLKLLGNKTTEEEEVIFEEEEEEFDDIDVDSIDFDCLSPLYLDIPSDIMNSISRNANSLESSHLVNGEMSNSGLQFDTNFSYQKMIEKCRYVPYLFQVPSQTFSPLYSKSAKSKSCLYSSDSVINNVTNAPSSLMSKTRYTPAFINMYQPLIENITRLSHSNYKPVKNDEIKFTIRPKIIHTSHFLSNVQNALSPFDYYIRYPRFKKKQEKIPQFYLPKVRNVPHMLTLVSSTVNPLTSFQGKGKQILPANTNRSVNIITENNEIQTKTIRKKIVRKYKNKNTAKKHNKNAVTHVNENENDNDNNTFDEVTSKRTIRRSVHKTVFVPFKFDDDEDNNDNDDNDVDDQHQEQIEKVEDMTPKSANTSSLKSKSNTRRNKRRAASARYKSHRVPGDSILTFRKIIIEADDSHDENDENQYNIDSPLPTKEENSKKSRKKKRRGCSVSHENSSPRKSNPK